MKFSQVFEENSSDVNKLVSVQLRYVVLLFFFVWFLNDRKIFAVNSVTLNKVMLLSVVVLLIPTVLTDIFCIRHWIVKYVNIFCTVLFVSLLYMYFTYHTVLMFVFPLVMASLYFNMSLTIFTIITSLVGMAVSHILSLYVGVIDSDPLETLYRVTVYGLLPRSIEYLVFSAIIILLSKRTSKLLYSFMSYSEDIKQNRDCLDVIVGNTNSMFQAKSEKELAVVVFQVFKCLIGVHSKIESDYEAYFGVVDSHGNYNVFSENLSLTKLRRTKERLVIPLSYKDLHIAYYYDKEDAAIFVKDGHLVMPFYESHSLNAFLVIQNHFISTDEMILTQELKVAYGNVKLAISNIRLSQEMYQTQEELVRAFAEICESKSKQTGQHIKRTSEYMKVMAKALKLQDMEQDALVIASMMHDIGKLMIPSEIIEKKGKLTEEEFAEIKKHVTYGFDLLKYSPGRVMEIAKTIALQHHEKWNGKGYLGMKGMEIDFYSRIMAVVDVFDALISKRSYKEKWTLEDAYNEIVNQSGEHFDPEVVRMFCEHFEEFKIIVAAYPD
ncbi:MAG: HD-GYP domain-containing protein [Clostridium sp.]|nr:HD-GYP domain-containing protein [Clostridium sp.]